MSTSSPWQRMEVIRWLNETERQGICLQAVSENRWGGISLTGNLAPVLRDQLPAPHLKHAPNQNKLCLVIRDSG